MINKRDLRELFEIVVWGFFFIIALALSVTFLIMIGGAVWLILDLYFQFLGYGIP